MGASYIHFHYAAHHYSASTELSFFAPSCLQTANPASEASASALYPHSPAASEGKEFVAATNFLPQDIILQNEQINSTTTNHEYSHNTS